MLETPTAYTLRHSPKAKYLQLRVSPRGVEIVIPAKRFIPQAEINQFVAQKQKWLERVQQKYYAEELQQPIEIPAQIYLTALAQEWQIQLCKTNSEKIKIVENANHQITLLGDIENKEKCLFALRVWLKRVASRYLSVELAKLSQITGLNYNRCTIRINTTRWGSCSANQDISLCCKLLFLPPELVTHIIIHELCHTKIMNHGTSFWRLLKKYDSQASLHAKQLKSAGTRVPRWV